MARIVKPLTDSKIRNAKPSPKEYNLPDGNGLHLRVKPSGSKTWIYNYKRPHDGKRTNLGLGVYPSISLVTARALRDKFRAEISLEANPKSNAHKEIRDTASFEQVSRRSLVMFERCEERALFDRWATVDFIAYLTTRSVAECDDPGG